MKNKLEKFLLSLASFFLGVIMIMGIKIGDINKQLESIKNDTAILSTNDLLYTNQSAISQTREKTLSNAAQAPASDVTASTTTTTVIPGKVVPVITTTKSSSPVTSKSTSTKTKAS